jgi:hypothetical protein
VIQDITLDTYGHITSLGSTNLDSRYYTETEAANHFKSLVVQGNFMNTYSWSGDTVGSVNSGWSALGSTAPFSGNSSYGQNGTDAENSRAVETLPNGAKGVVWQTPSNDSASGADGGWNCTINGVDSTKAYRSVIYFRRTDDSTSGTFYHGCAGSHTLNTNGTVNTNPYFKSQSYNSFVQDRWYVSIGYIQPYQASGTTNSVRGGIYDCTTGKKVFASTDFMMKNGSTSQQHRTYLYYSTDTSTSIDFYGPRFEEVNGNEPSTQELVNKGLDGLAAMSFHSKYDPEALSQLTESSDANDDKLLLWDKSASEWKYMRLDDLQDSIDNNTTYSVGDGGLTQKNFTTTLKSKLDGIESSADVTDTTNVVAALTAGSNVSIASNGTISATNTNTQLSNEQVQDIVGAMVASNSESGITVTYQDGDGTLDFSVASQTDQNFTNADHTKLNGIETGATADQTAAEILAAIKTVDVNGTSGVNAGTFDGLQLHSGRNNEANKVVRTQGNGYIEAGWINTTSGDVGSAIPSRIYTNNSVSGDAFVRYADLSSFRSLMNVSAKATYQGREQSTSDTNYWVGTMGWGSTDFDTIWHYGSGHIESWSNPTNAPSTETSHWTGHQSLHYTNGSTQVYGHQLVVGAGNPAWCYLRGRWGTSATSWAKMWNSLNDGSGSGLDADKLDGLQGSSFLRSDATDTATGSITLSNANNHYSGHHYFDSYDSSGNHYPHYLNGSSGSAKVNIRVYNAGGGSYDILYFAAGSNNPTWRGNKIWNAANDGSGSGLDADKLDGLHASSFNQVIGTDSDINTSGATVVDQLNMTDGVIQSHSTRTLTLADLGYTGATNANYITNNNQLTNGAGYVTTDTNTTYSAGRGLDLSGTEFQLETDLRDSISYIGYDSNDYLQWSNNSYVRAVVSGSERFRVNTSGIDVTGTATANAFRTDTGNTDYNVISRNSTSTTLWVQAAQSGSIQGIASFRYGSATVNQGTEVCAIRRNSSYFINTKLGVGTNNPQKTLDVSGDVGVAGNVEFSSSSNGVILKSPNGYKWRVTVNNSGMISTTNVS